MVFLKKNIGAILFILGVLLINALLWIQKIQSAFLSFDVLQTSLLGSSLLMGFFLVFLLSTRIPFIVKIFGGLEGLYFWHRILAIFTTAAIFIHGFFAVGNVIAYSTYIPLLGYAGRAGELARNGFLFLIAIALLAKFMKYEHFRLIHRLLIIPYFISLYHGFFSSWVDLFRFDTLSIWMLATSIIGLGSSLYMIILYQSTAFRFKGIIVSKMELTDSIVELKVKLNRRFRFKPGQFAFIKIDQEGISKGPHPFSISGSDGEFIYFTIKALGDFTGSLQQKLSIPASVKITRPFGSMTFRSKKEKQIWIAGGIGITPFLGYLRSQPDFHKNIHLYYSVRFENEAVHTDILKNLAAKNTNFTFTLFDASKEGYLTSKHMDLDENTIVYLCGPRPMVLSLEKQIRSDHPGVEIDYEAFSFTGTLVEDILRSIKKVIKKRKATT